MKNLYRVKSYLTKDFTELKFELQSSNSSLITYKILQSLAQSLAIHVYQKLTQSKITWAYITN